MRKYVKFSYDLMVYYIIDTQWSQLVKRSKEENE